MVKGVHHQEDNGASENNLVRCVSLLAELDQQLNEEISPNDKGDNKPHLIKNGIKIIF